MIAETILSVFLCVDIVIVVYQQQPSYIDLRVIVAFGVIIYAMIKGSFQIIYVLTLIQLPNPTVHKYILQSTPEQIILNKPSQDDLPCQL